MIKDKTKRKSTVRWHASQESDELVFAVCDRYFMQLGRSSQALADDQHTRGAASAVADWIQKAKGRTDLTREKIYPLFWEACHRGFLLLQPPPEHLLEEKLTNRFALQKHPGKIDVINVNGDSAAQHVTSKAVDNIVGLIDQVWKRKQQQFPNEPEKQAVHLGMGAGYATMLVARRLAYKIRSGSEIPHLVLHAISSGGFLPDEPQKSPSTYFSYFDPSLMNIKFVALFSATVVESGDYEKMLENPAVRYSFEQRDKIDIIVTSLAAADHVHGLLGHYLAHLVQEHLLPEDTIPNMRKSGWIGDVQFRPYSPQGPLQDVCPVRAVTLFELDELVEIANTPDNDRHVVLVAGPCGECGETKQHALRPLLDNPALRLWTHLVTDANTAKELLER